MASLIPSYIEDGAPSGEREVFNRLSMGPEECVGLHSLDLSPWNKGKRTEIDFLWIIPDTGIVCIEVKSDKEIYFDHDGWHPTTIKRSPFKQALDARGALYRRLKKILPYAKHIPVIHVCIFTNSDFDLPKNLAIQPWELIDSKQFRSFRSPSEFCAALKERALQSIAADERIHRLTSPVGKTLINDIINHCTPIRRRMPSAAAEIQKRQEKAEQALRKQQRPVLRLAQENPRLVVWGAAGTGKTHIALEVAIRAAEQGARVGLLCYNTLLGQWISEKVKSLDPPLPNLIPGSATKVLADLTDTCIPENPPQEFWEIALPEKIMRRLTDPEFKPAALFDYLVVDEAQDILARPFLWDCLTHFIAGGLVSGCYCLLGDFEFQVLSDRDQMERSLAQLSKDANPARWPLDENCRNYRIVGETAIALSGLKAAGKSVYSDYMRSGKGSEVYKISWYVDESQQLDQIAKWIEELKRGGFKDKDITLLSFRKNEKSSAVALKKGGFKLRPFGTPGNGMTYASVHKFKGLENEAIILTDVFLNDADFSRDLFYTGITRAREEIRIACDLVFQQKLLEWMKVV